MKKGFVLLALTGFFFIVPLLSRIEAAVTPPPAANVRYVTCDACGYCPKVINGETSSCEKVEGSKPGNWETCVKCLYPDLYPEGSNPNPEECETLKIEGNAKLPPQPARGRQYTAIGCLTTQGGFQNDKGLGASSFVQAIFDLLVFRVIGGIAFLYLMYGSFIILTSQADPERLNYGRRVVTGAAVGLIFALSSVFIVNLIGSGILRLPGFSGQATPTPGP